jgi:hypothetical protein
MTASPFAAGFDNAVVVDGHVVWELLTEAQQIDLEANFPRQGGLNEEQTEAWLDTAYIQRTTVSMDKVEWLT